MKEIIFSDDRYEMNWIRPDYPYAEVKTSKRLDIKTEHEVQKDFFTTRIIFENKGKVPVFTTREDISVSFPLQDRYESSEICMTERCHSHIFCGNDISYIMALRMGGEAPHLGMVVTKGSLSGYSIQRDFSKMSNDRGCFLLHPSEMEILPGENYVLEWVIFSHKGKEDFYEQAGKIRDFVRVEADSYVLYEGESTDVSVKVNFPVEYVEINDEKIPVINGKANFTYTADVCGDKVFTVRAGNIQTWCRLYVQKKLSELAEKRCHFIVREQQYHGNFEHLKGAFLVYDNEEKHIFYSDLYDYNGGRERVGMGILLAEYLKNKQSSDELELRKSLDEYADYIIRELLIPETMEVCNDIAFDNEYKRLYNWPWFARFFIEMYGLTGKRDYLEYAYKIMNAFYEQDGKQFYPIELPVISLIHSLKEAGMEENARKMLIHFKEHADTLLGKGLHYPASEVNYEQSIVGPAAEILLQVYILTGEKIYLDGGKEQLRVLELFNGTQPDYHLYETAIRHWDGYWFGKKKMYGDTFPHYWSAITGNAYWWYYIITEDEAYLKKAKDSIRGVLPMFFEDGRASCAYVYPKSVNNVESGYWDPYANDQDWGLYFNLRLQRWKGEKVWQK